MITRQQYLEALDIVETYHRQFRDEIPKIKAWDDLRAGDKVIFAKSPSKYILEGKEYTVIFVSHDWRIEYCSYFEFICENGTIRSISKYPKKPCRVAIAQ